MNMTFSEFVDLLLARLYEADQASPGNFIELNLLNEELKEPAPLPWVRDAAKILESRGLARSISAFGGFLAAELTGEGRLFFEEGRTPLLKKYKENRDIYIVNVAGAGNQVAVGGAGSVATQSMTIEKEREPAFRLLTEIENDLERDTNLNGESLAELKADVDAVRQQLKKREPNRPALAALLDPISKIVSVAGKVANLINLINQ